MYIRVLPGQHALAHGRHDYSDGRSSSFRGAPRSPSNLPPPHLLPHLIEQIDRRRGRAHKLRRRHAEGPRRSVVVGGRLEKLFGRDLKKEQANANKRAAGSRRRRVRRQPRRRVHEQRGWIACNGGFQTKGDPIRTQERQRHLHSTFARSSEPYENASPHRHLEHSAHATVPRERRRAVAHPAEEPRRVVLVARGRRGLRRGEHV